MSTLNNDTDCFELSISGALDAAEVQKLREDLDYLAQSNHGQVRINLAEVDFLDSSGIGAIVFLYKRLAQDGRQLEITQVSGQPLQLLKYLRIDRTVSVSPA